MAVSIPILTEYNPKGVDQATKSLKGLVKSQLGVAVSGAGLLDLTRRSIIAYNDDAKAQRSLANTLRNTVSANSAVVKSVEGQIASLQSSALVLDDTLRPAFQKLIGVTKDTTAAFDLLKVGIDISAYTGKDLETVTSSLSRAYQGNVGALRRLGLGISNTAIKTKDFNLAMSEVKPVVKGANDVINQGANGAWKKLSILANDTAEAVGEIIVNTGSSVINLGSLFDALTSGSDKAGKKSKGFFGKIGGWIRDARDGLSLFNDVLSKTVTTLNGGSANWSSIWGGDTTKRAAEDAKKLADQQLRLADATNKAAAAAERAKEKEKARAKQNRQNLKDAVNQAKQELASLQDEIANFNGGIIDSINGLTSLADAVNQSKSADDAYTAALDERRAAYEELNKVVARGVDERTGSRTAEDAADYAAAMERVAKAEAGVTTAQSQRKSYTELFRDQINAAKEFAGTLKQLVDKGLNQTGLQNLINLGPVVGNEVAKDILSGASGLQIGDVNQYGISGNASDLAASMSSAIFGSQLTAAQNLAANTLTAQTFNITVTSADPQKVVDALVEWSKKNGKLPSVVQTA